MNGLEGLMGGVGGVDPLAAAAGLPEPEEELDPDEHLQAAIEHAQAALVAEPDNADSQALSKLVSSMYAILARRQKDTDKVMGDPTLLRTLRRTR